MNGKDHHFISRATVSVGRINLLEDRKLHIPRFKMNTVRVDSVYSDNSSNQTKLNITHKFLVYSGKPPFDPDNKRLHCRVSIK